MKLKITKSKVKCHYSIFYDYTTIDGKRTTRVFENLGNQKQVGEKFGKVNTLNKGKNYVLALSQKDKEEILRKEFNPNKRILGNIKRKFNVGYLFLKNIYHKLHIKRFVITSKKNIEKTTI